MSKVYIQDYVKATMGEPQQKLPDDAVVVFVTDTGKLEVHLTEDGQLVIRKTNGPAGNDRIRIFPQVQNVIVLD